MTIQAPDSLIYEGVQCRLKTEMPVPPRAFLTVVSNEEARASLSVFRTTACWRNFVAAWEIRAGRMYLNGIRGLYRLAEAQPLAAEWVGGNLAFEEVEVITDFWDEDYNSGVSRAFTATVRAGLVHSTSYLPRVRHAA